ncbi:MAG: hypothetical protein AAF725_06525 [Acidobacteriota bacterium]
MTSENFRVPQRQVKVRVKLEGGQDLNGLMYVPSLSHGGSAGRLIDRLNENADSFMPLTVGIKTHLLNVRRIVLVRVEDETEERVEQEIEEKESEYSRRLRVRMRLATGDVITGLLSYLRPKGQERLLDYLNTERRFLPLHVDRLIYVNRLQIGSVFELDDEPSSF